MARFISQALPGEIIGSEAMLFSAYAFAAAQRVILPTRQDIADINALRLETVSRIIKRLGRDGLPQPVRIDGVHAACSFGVGAMSAAGEWAPITIKR